MRNKLRPLRSRTELTLPLASLLLHPRSKIGGPIFTVSEDYYSERLGNLGLAQDYRMAQVPLLELYISQ